MKGSLECLENNYNINLSQKPIFETCGIMLDVSRGAVLKPEKDNEMLARLSTELSTLAEEIAKLRELRIKLWFENNKPFGFEQVNKSLLYKNNSCKGARVIFCLFAVF